MGDDKVFALADCNNFFVSCERLFQPALRNKPVAVLSNNDGVIIARSNEVKALGIPMGAPVFKHRSLLEAHNARLFSANFTLYGDISDRVASILREQSPWVEVYSIDESFLRIDHLGISDYSAWAQRIAAQIQKEVGVPISIGVGSTKTLAKLATEWTKKHPDLRGGCSLVGDARLTETTLQQTDLQDIWGIGRRYGEKLRRLGLRTALDVVRLKDEWVLHNMTVLGLKTVHELRGKSCIPLNDFSVDYQQKMASSTRSFGRKVRSLAELEAAIASLSARAAMRLRRVDQLAWQGSTFLRAHLPEGGAKYLSANFYLPTPTAFTGDITKGAHHALHQIYDSDFRYEKGGVIMSGLVDVSAQQMSLLGASNQVKNMQKQDALMAAVDDLALRYGKTTVIFASERASSGSWQSKRSNVSPLYTTHWEHLPHVQLG